jgi:hypothetical protein
MRARSRCSRTRNEEATRSFALVLRALAGGAMVWLWAGTALAADMDTRFTYQGQLEKLGVEVDDTCDFDFELYDADTSGSQVGATVSKPSVDVDEGLFTVELNFGTAAYTGEKRWLEISAQCTGDGSPTVLDPRQELTAAPHAAYALNGPWMDPQDEIAIPLDLFSGFVGDATVVMNRYNAGVDAIHNSTDEQFYFHLPLPSANVDDGRSFVITRVAINRASGSTWYNRFIWEIEPDGTGNQLAFSNSSYTQSINWNFPDITTNADSRYTIRITTTQPASFVSDRIYGITVYGHWE